MKFAINCSFSSHSTVALTDYGRAIEDRGFDSIFLAEHTHIPVKEVSPYPFGDRPASLYDTVDPFVALSVLAGVTKQLLLGTGISLVAQRDPITTAKMIASLDLLSDGRFVFGIGTGWNAEETATHGVDPTKRGAVATEHLLAMKEIWLHDKAEFHGSYLDFDPIFSWPKPVQRPHPPIYVGGGDKAFPRVVAVGGGWFPNPESADGLGRRIQRLRDLAGREVPVTVLHVGPAEPRIIAGYAELDVERVVFPVDTSAPNPMATLDHLAALTAGLTESVPA